MIQMLKQIIVEGEDDFVGKIKDVSFRHFYFDQILKNPIHTMRHNKYVIYFYYYR
jgi:hypothetical protein